MKKYDLSKIMRNAHRTYKYVGKKQGKSFGEVLKSTWRLAKMDIAIQEAEEKKKAEAAKKAAEWKPTKVERGDYKGYLPESALYNSNSRGYLGSQYCGD